MGFANGFDGEAAESNCAAVTGNFILDRAVGFGELSRFTSMLLASVCKE